MLANWFYLAGSLCFVIGTAINLGASLQSNEEEEPEETSKAFGFNVVQDGSTCDGGNYDGWEDE